jgi:hypothetical protein
MLKKEEALAELTSRYFTSRGPATIRDFSTWSGLKIADCKKGIEMMNRLIQKEVIEGQEYFFNPNTSLSSRQPDKIWLLPIYDEFIMGYRDRSAIMPSKANAPFRYDCMIVYNGQIIGTWKRTLSKNTIDFEHAFFKPLNKLQSEIFDEAINRLSEFMNLRVNRIMTEKR